MCYSYDRVYHVSSNKTRGIKQRKLICHYCKSARATTSDHIVPKVMGGPQSMWNIQPACGPCNSAKTDSWPSCTCEKCQSAILTFLKNPEWTDQAVNLLAGRYESLGRHLDSILQIKVPSLQAKQDEVARQKEELEGLILTYRYPFSIVEL